MKAICVNEFGAPDVMRLEEIETPQVGANQILVKVEAIGVNPVDTYKRSGNYAHKPSLPYTPGSDAAGTIVETGEGITKWQVNQRVYLSGAITGTYAEYALCEESHVHRLPDDVSFEEGAGMGVPFATAYRALFQKAGVEPGETVFIHGASGGVGIAAVQLASAAGLRVIGTAGTDRGLQLVKEQGADYVVNHHKENYLDEVLGLADGEGVDVVIEMLANVNLNKDFEVLKKGGRVVVIGNRGTLEFNPRLTMSKEATIHGMSLHNATQDVLKKIHSALEAGLEKGFLRPVIGKKFSLAEAPKAHEDVLAAGAFGKIILVP
jgi:NADPH2:quinone reductase